MNLTLTEYSQNCCSFEILNKVGYMNGIELNKLYHFDEMFDDTSKPHSCYMDYNEWLSCEEPRNLKKKTNRG